MKRKNISILLIVSLIMSLLPVSSVCAFTSEELDAAIGTLGDKGTYYVEGDSLPVSTVIGENTYDITYTSEPSGIISENGSITRNSSFSYVTVTPNANGVSGTPQRLLILPKSLDEEIFESFEGENFKPAEGNSLTLTAGGTYNGWELSKFKDGATISSVKDTSGNTSIKMQVTDDTAPTAPTISSEDITWKNEGKIVVSMRLKASGSFDIPMFPISSTVQKTKIAARKQDTSKGTVLNALSITEEQWHDLLFLIDRDDTVSDSAGAKYSKTEVFIDGESCGHIYTYDDLSTAQPLKIAPKRSVKQTVEVDDILIANILPEVQETKTQNAMYVENGTQLPTQISYNGEESSVVYNDATGIIQADGTVLFDEEHHYITVQRTITGLTSGSVATDEQKVLIFPKRAESVFVENFESDSFKPAEGQTELSLLPNGTYNGWTVSNFIQNQRSIKAIQDGENRYLKLESATTDSDGANIFVTRRMTPSSEGKAYIATRLKINSPQTTSNNASFAMLPAGYLYNTKFYAAESDKIHPYQTGIDINLDETKWYDFLFVINYEDRKIIEVSSTSSYTGYAMDIYINGELIESCYTRGDATKLQLELQRKRIHSGEIDDILVSYVKPLKIDTVWDAPYCVNTNQLPTEMLVDGVSYPCTFETDNTAVVSEDGVVTRGETFVYVNVTPKSSVSGKIVKGDTKRLLILPLGSKNLFYENFESEQFQPTGEDASLILTPGGEYNGWTVTKFDATGRKAEIVKEKNNSYLSMSADGSNKTGANINLTKNIDIKSGWPTLVAARVKVNSSQRQTNNAYFSLMPGGYFCNTKFYAAESDKIHPYQTGIDINLDSVSWHDFLFVIDYDDEKNIEITSTTSYTGYRMDLYIDGTFIESCYTRGDCTKIAVELYRGWAHNGAIDDITVERIPDISKIQQYLDDIELEDNDELIENVRLVTLEDDYSKLSYSLDCDESVAQILDNTLFIHRSNNDVPIVLTANLECNGFIKTKVFNLIVKGISALETESLKFVDISNGQAETAVTENLELPDTCGNGISIEWVSNTPDTVTITGELKRGKLDKRGSLTATYLKNGERFVKTYNFIISGIGKVVYMTDFNDAEAEGVSVDTLSGWTIGGTEDIHQEKSVNSTVEKNPMDTIKSFEESGKVLKVERFATKADRLVSNDKAMLDFGTVTKSEQTTYDFDFMFLSSGRIMIEMHDMQMTYVITQKGIGQYGKEIIPFASPLKQGFWYHGTIMQDAYLGLYEFYLDYELVGSASLKGIKGIKGMNFYSNAVSTTVNDKFLIGNITVKEVTIDEMSAVKAGINALTEPIIDYDTAKVILPAYSAENTYVTWTSDDTDTITNEGIVNRVEREKTVKMTATVSKGSYSEEKEFHLQVASLSGIIMPTQEIMQVIADDLTFDLISTESPLMLTKDLKLIDTLDFGKAREIGGVTVSWESEYPSILTSEGQVRRSPYSSAVTLKATIKSTQVPAMTITKNFKLAVIPDSEVIFSFDGSECTEAERGETISEWTLFDGKVKASGEEYGIRKFVDKAPGEGTLPFDVANKVIYLDRVLNDDMAYTPNVEYIRYNPSEEKQAQITDNGNVLVSYKFMLTDLYAPSIVTINALREQNYQVSRTGIKRANLNPKWEVAFPEALESDRWYELGFFFDILSKRMEIYLDGKRIHQEPIPVEALNASFSSFQVRNDGFGIIYLDDIKVECLKPSDGSSEILMDSSKLLIQQTCTENIVLPTIGVYGSRISWETSDENIISASGVIYPSSVRQQSAILTATLRYGKTVTKKEFNVTVAKSSIIPYEINNIVISDNKLKSISISGSDIFEDGKELVLLIKDQNRLVDINNISLNQMSDGKISTEIDLSKYLNYTVTAFIWNRNQTQNGLLSNKLSVDWRR